MKAVAFGSSFGPLCQACSYRIRAPLVSMIPRQVFLVVLPYLSFQDLHMLAITCKTMLQGKSQAEEEAYGMVEIELQDLSWLPELPYSQSQKALMLEVAGQAFASSCPIGDMHMLMDLPAPFMRLPVAHRLLHVMKVIVRHSRTAFGGDSGQGAQSQIIVLQDTLGAEHHLCTHARRICKRITHLCEKMHPDGAARLTCETADSWDWHVWDQTCHEHDADGARWVWETLMASVPMRVQRMLAFISTIDRIECLMPGNEKQLEIIMRAWGLPRDEALLTKMKDICSF